MPIAINRLIRCLARVRAMSFTLVDRELFVQFAPGVGGASLGSARPFDEGVAVGQFLGRDVWVEKGEGEREGRTGSGHWYRRPRKRS